MTSFPIRRLVICVVLCASTAAIAAPRTWRTEFSLGHDSNLANARDGAPERDAFFALGAIGTETAWPMGDQAVFLSQLRAEGQAHEEFEGLDRLRGAVQLRALTRPGRGFHVPTIALTGLAAWDEFDSRARDGAEYRLSAFLQQPVTTRIALRASVGGSWRDTEAAAFATHTSSAGIDLDWTVGARAALYAGWQYRRGDFVTTTPAVSAPVAASARAISPDDAFDGQTAVRLDGDGEVANLGFNFALTRTWSLDAQVLSARIESDLGTRYRRVQTFASLLGRF